MNMIKNIFIALAIASLAIVSAPAAHAGDPQLEAAISAGEVGERIVVEFEDDPPGAVVAGLGAITDAQAGGAQSIDRNGDLVLGTDGARPSTLILYMMHRSKG